MSSTQIGDLNQPLAKRDKVLWMTAVSLFAFLQFLLAKDAADGRLFTAVPTNYYHYAADAVLSGQLSLKILPRAELLALPDPYDPALNQPYRLHDASLYRGKYYFYWGLSPVILFFAPLKILTGWWPSESLAVAFFGTVCIGAFSWIILAIRRVYYPSAGYFTAILAMLCLACCTLLSCVAANNHVYAVPISCAAACYGVAWVSALLGVIRPAQALKWGFLCGLALALTLGARPNYLLWLPAFLFVLLPAVRSRPSDGWKIASAAIAPILLSVACLLLLNLERFGHLLEFGLKYQLTGSRQFDVAFVSLRHFSSNWKSYGWNPISLDRYFPFLTLGPEDTFGIFTALPVAWLAVGLVWVRAGGAFQGWLRGLVLSCALSLGAACSFSAAVQRYMIDFLPGIVLAGGICALWLDHLYRGRMALRGSLAALLISSALVGGLVQVQSWSVSQPTRIRLLLPIARFLNGPVFAWEALHSPPSDGKRIVLRFPKDRLGAFEPILSVPAKPNGGELVFVNYVDDMHVRLGYFQTGISHWLSAPIFSDYSVTHVVDIRLGSLSPPASYPAYRQWPKAAVQAALGQVDIYFDDAPVYHTVLDFGSSHGARSMPGLNNLAPGASGPTFAGKILSIENLPLFPPAPPLRASWMMNPIDFSFQMMPQYGPEKEEIFFSAFDAEGNRTLLAVKHPSASSVAFVFKTTGQPDCEGPVLGSLRTTPHRLLLAVGPWLVNAPPSRRSLVEVYLDDDLVLSHSMRGHMNLPSVVLAGRAAADADSASAYFSGYITEAMPVPLAAAALSSSARNRLHFGPWRLKVRFPAGAPPGYHDPLLVSGAAGKGDFVYAFYPKPGEVAFSHDCWGIGGETSSAIAIDTKITHVVEIEYGGLYPPLDDPLWDSLAQSQRLAYKSSLRITLDGAVVLDGASQSDDASPNSVTPCINSIGGSSTGPQFLGQLISAERQDW